MSTVYSYARATDRGPLAGQLEALRAHGVDDGNLFVEADNAPDLAWTRLLARLTEGVQVIVTRPHVLADTGRSREARCEQARERGAHLTPIVAGIPERIAMRGGSSRWLARQTGR